VYTEGCSECTEECIYCILKVVVSECSEDCIICILKVVVRIV
jgi:hypothetical protein